jgi:diadenosine tetraphosphate (Ap4A) HIT family hydrolase
MGIEMNATCALCCALHDEQKMGGKPKMENIHLHETPRFVIMPCIGPLVPGHVLIVGKEHYLSLASMGREAIAEYEELVRVAAQRPPFSTQGILEAEHGSTAAERAGACVVHAHIHLMPGLQKHSGMFDGGLKLIKAGTCLLELASITSPYIFVRGNLRRWCVYEASCLHSQMIRRTLCEVLGRDDINWKQSPRYDWIESTIKAWGVGT